MRLFILILFTPFFSFSQIDPNYLNGKWIVFATSNFKLEDCNDEIQFKENGEYFIYNDCYGDAETALIEKGKWELKGKKKLIFKDRKILTNLPSFDTNSNVNFEVKFIRPKHFELFSWGFGSFFIRKKSEKKCVVQKISSKGDLDTILYPIHNCSRVRVGYVFFNDPDQIEVGDQRSISFKKIGPVNNIEEEFIDLMINYKLGFPLKVIASNPDSKWIINLYYYFDPND